MKKIIIALLAGILLLNLISCANENQDYSYNIKDALKISAYLFDENSGEDYFVYDEATKQYKYNTKEELYSLEQLEINEVRLLLPLWTSALNLINLNIHFEFDGIIEVISADEDVQLSVNNPLVPFLLEEEGVNDSKRSYGFEFKLINEGFIAMNPLGSHRAHLFAVGWLPYSPDREYYLDVNAYKFANEQYAVIRARLRLVQLEDKAVGGHAEQSSMSYSIELISYEYSDMYKIMYEIDDEEE